MTTGSKVLLGCVAAVGAAVLWLVLGHAGKGDGQVTLTFESYSDLDPFVSNVAFLRLANTSNQPYLCLQSG